MEQQKRRWQVREAYREEWQEAMALAWRTFLKFEAQDYGEEGTQSFREFVTDSSLYRMFVAGSYELIVAVEDDHMIGMITVRNESHISLLFVDEKHQMQGVGRSLVEYLRNYLLSEVGVSRVTVNASPYGLGFYHRLGFRDLGSEQIDDGIRYTPMEFVL